MKVKFNMQMYIYSTQIDTIELCMRVPGVLSSLTPKKWFFKKS